VRYLSDAWFDAARRAVAGDDELQAAMAGMALTIEQVVTGGPGGTVRWHLSLGDSGVAITEGPAAAPDIRFTTDYATASDIAAGRLSAQHAFAEGRLKVGGDLSALIRHQRAFAALDDALAGVRAETAFA
jgi:hypothetical protein